jgi:glycerophosphoryl diester phosphodiesterase
VAHRGAAAVAPENTLPAFDAAVEAGAPVEADVRMTSDGWPVIIHDTTVDRTTDGSGEVAVKTLAEIRGLNASDVMPGFVPTQVPTLDELLGRYTSSALIMAHAYTFHAGAEVAVRAAGDPELCGRVVLASFYRDELAAYSRIAPGLGSVLLGLDNAPPSLADLSAARAWAAGPSTAGLTQAYVTSLKDAGYGVIAYSSATTDRIVDAEEVIRWGVDGFVAFDPTYMHQFLNAYTPSGATLPVPESFPAPGWSGNAADDGTAGLVSSEGYVHAERGLFVFPPLRVPDASWKIDTALKLISKDLDETRFLALRFAWKQDRDVTVFGAAGSSGYHFAYRSHGKVEICRDSGSTVVSLGSASWPPLGVGGSFTLRIEVTPSTITVTRTDTGHVLTVSDATYARDGFVDVLGATPTHRVGIGPTTITY